MQSTEPPGCATMRSNESKRNVWSTANEEEKKLVPGRAKVNCAKVSFVPASGLGLAYSPLEHLARATLDNTCPCRLIHFYSVHPAHSLRTEQCDRSLSLTGQWPLMWPPRSCISVQWRTGGPSPSTLTSIRLLSIVL
ncbi:unnamed protein product [Periconia digitata]|uniref:Uncharacterized protein n=1 Tax=Periconia digitata TaxID=1303443 RepID=A0A9W4UA79_9PLEO|nr:unnamed protein product [Periconia digitata]